MAKWSYSSMSLFKLCPKKYYHLRVLKSDVEPPSEAMLYGSEVHKALELYGKSGTPLPEKYSYTKPYIDSLLDYPGTKYFEYEMGVTKELSSCGFGSKDYWWRGIADFVSIDNDKAYVFDWKTGKSAKYADVDQLELLSLGILTHFPDVTTVRSGLIFVVSGEFFPTTGYIVTRDQMEKRWKRWFKNDDRLDTCISTDTWNASHNFTCRAHCPVTSCHFNGNH